MAKPGWSRYLFISLHRLDGYWIVIFPATDEWNALQRRKHQTDKLVYRQVKELLIYKTTLGQFEHEIGRPNKHF